MIFLVQLIWDYILNNGYDKLVLAQDYRSKSAQLAQALSTTCDSVRVGVMPTPCISYAEGFTGIITASHNPANYNGLKLFIDNLLFAPVDSKYQSIIEEYNLLNENPQNEFSINDDNETIDKELRQTILNNYLAVLEKGGILFS